MISPITPWSENVRGHLQRETFGEDKTLKKTTHLESLGG